MNVPDGSLNRPDAPWNRKGHEHQDACRSDVLGDFWASPSTRALTDLIFFGSEVANSQSEWGSEDTQYVYVSRFAWDHFVALFTCNCDAIEAEAKAAAAEQRMGVE